MLVLDYIRQMILSENTSNALAGRWSLETYENFQSPGHSILISEGQSGYLEYSQDGRVAVSIRRDEMQLKSLELGKHLGEIEYRGRYEVDESNHTVYHHIEKANDPTRIGKTLTRKYLLTGDHLEITGTGLEGRVKLTWARIR